MLSTFFSCEEIRFLLTQLCHHSEVYNPTEVRIFDILLITVYFYGLFVIDLSSVDHFKNFIVWDELDLNTTDLKYVCQ